MLLPPFELSLGRRSCLDSELANSLASVGVEVEVSCGVSYEVSMGLVMRLEYGLVRLCIGFVA